MQKFLIYKITNTINKKLYIGKHKTFNINDGYMGSGKLLLAAQKKYGIENFKKEILFVFDTEEEMNHKEKEIVTEDFCARTDTYNLCIGGQGGFSYINNNSLNVSIEEQRLRDPELRIRSGKLGAKALKIKHDKDPKFKDQHYAKISAALRANPPRSFEGKTHTEETKKKMSLIKKEKYKGAGNPSFGSIWITDGKNSKKIKGEIPDGWVKGRKI